MKYLICILLLIIFDYNLFGQSSILRSPEKRRDFANVFYDPKYTLFDYWSDEPIFPDKNGIYNIYYATNEFKTPQSFNGNNNKLSELTAYKFKSYINCYNWCNNIIFENKNELNNNYQSKSNDRDISLKYTQPKEIIYEQIKEILIPFKDGKEYGYKNRNGDIVIKPKFDFAFPFYSYNGQNESSAIIINNNKYFIIDNEGKKISRNSFQYISNDFHRNIRLYSENKKIGFISKTGKLITENLYDAVHSLVKGETEKRESEYFILRNNEFYTFSKLISKDGNLVLDNLSTEPFEEIFDIKLNSVILNDNLDKTFDTWTDQKIHLQFPTNHFIIKNKDNYSYIYKDSTEQFATIASFDSILSIENLNKSIPTFRIIKDGKYGLLDFHGRILLNPTFDFIESFNNDYAITKIGLKYGVIDFKGKTILANEIDSIKYVDNEHQKIYKNGKIGLLNRKMEIFVPIMYDQIKIEDPNLIYVEKNGLFGLYFKNKKVLDEIYSYIGGKDSHGLIKFKKEKLHGIFRDYGVGANVIIDPEYDSLNINKKYIEAFKNSKTGRFDLYGNKLLDCLYDSIMIFENTNNLRLINNSKYGLSDISGSIKIPVEYDSIFSIRNQIVNVISGIKIGFYNLINESKVEPKFDNLLDIFPNTQYLKTQLNNKFGLISLSGSELIDAIFDDLIAFNKSNTTIVVKKNGLLGLVNNTGQIVFEPKFQNIYESNLDGYWISMFNNKYGVVSNLGLEVIKPIYDNIGEFKNQLASVRLNNKFGFINSEGIEIIAPIYDNYFEFQDDKAFVVLNGRNLKINKSGDEIFNEFDQFSLSELTRDGKPLPKIISEKVDKILSEINSQMILNQYLGKSFDAENNFKKATSDLKEQEELSLKGPMNKKQSDEFNKIVLESANKFASNVKLVNSFLRSSDAYESKSQENTTGRSSGKQSNSNGSDECNYCKPHDKKGLYIQNFNVTSRTYSGGRYVLRPGYKVCETCSGTGDCRIRCSGGKRDCPGICDDSGICQTCKGDRFVVCRRCNGSGRKTD
jgi:hypothetical protein